MILIAIENKQMNRVYVYDEKKKIFDVQGELYHYTSNTVVVKNGAFYNIYNESGEIIKTYPTDYIPVDNIIL